MDKAWGGMASSMTTPFYYRNGLTRGLSDAPGQLLGNVLVIEESVYSESMTFSDYVPLEFRIPQLNVLGKCLNFGR